MSNLNLLSISFGKRKKAQTQFSFTYLQEKANIMTLRFKQIYYFAFVAIVFLLNNITFAQTRACNANDRQVQTILNPIESRTNTFRKSVDQAVDNSNINGSNREDSLNSYFKDFEQPTDKLRQNFDARDSVSTEVKEVLRSSLAINSFVNNLSLSNSVERQWNLIRPDVEQVRQSNGNTDQVNHKGTIRNSSQTTKTVTRAGISAILETIIDAVVDGGKVRRLVGERCPCRSGFGSFASSRPSRTCKPFRIYNYGNCARYGGK